MKTYDELLAERDALAAQLRLIKNIFRDDSLSPSETLRKIPFVIDLSAEQCLAEIKAEAGRDGFVAGRLRGVDYFKLTEAQAADEYAAKIRNAGTWLKDSNINGGKRQREV